MLVLFLPEQLFERHVNHRGDGQSDNYTSTLVHGYSDGRLHEVTIEASGASTASLSSLVGIEKVDLSGF